jgi:hypothetical protein
MDRQDIDALLVGALYGELTPADEARLAAHLESHPADRGALDDLKSARAAVRESRIFELQHEPPQAVSALLLQEAHRRAPRRVAVDSGEEQESWFFRFTRVFMAHPAMAAAAMLVLVVGVFGVVQINRGQAPQFAEKTYSPATQMEMAQDTITNEAIAPGAEPSADTATTALAMDPGAADEGGEGKDAYRVELDDNARGRALSDREAADKLAREEQANKKAKGMIVTTPQPQPKELASSRTRSAPTKAPPKPAIAKNDYARGDLDGLAVGGTATASGAAAPRAGDGADFATAPQGKVPAASTSAAPPPPTAVATAPSTTAKSSTAKQAQEKPADVKAEAAPAQAAAKDSSLIAWAKGEHSRTIALANKGDCIAAAKLAVVVQNRAPDYYTQFMATDRALKKCQAYIAQERDAEAERSGKARAQKRVNADQPASTK